VVFPLTIIVSGWGPDPRFWVLVFGHETWRPNADAVSAKLERHVAAEAGDSTKKTVSSAYTKSVKTSHPMVIPGRDFMCLNIQSIATQKSAGARTQLCLTPEVVGSEWVRQLLSKTDTKRSVFVKRGDEVQ